MTGSAGPAGPVVFVSGGGGGFSGVLAAALERRGARVGSLGDAADLSSLSAAVAAFDAATAAVGEPEAVVHAAVDPLALEARAVSDTDDGRFDVVWERAMRATLFLLQAAHARFGGRGGRIVLVTPTLALSGAKGLASYAAAVEGQRLLAKSAARQWGADGITVNCIAPSAGVVGVAPDDLGTVTLSPPALGDHVDVADDIVPVVEFLIGPAGHHVTGATLAVDGGAWLAP